MEVEIGVVLSRTILETAVLLGVFYIVGKVIYRVIDHELKQTEKEECHCQNPK